MAAIDLRQFQIVLLTCGSFNPPTKMHLKLFELAKNYLEKHYSLSVVEGIISPVADNFGKPELISAVHRVKMAELAAQHYPWIRADSYECSQKQWSRTLTILEYHQNRINEQYPNKRRVMLLCGGDLIDSFARILPNGENLWHPLQLQEIMTKYGIVVVNRPDSKPRETLKALKLPEECLEGVLFVEGVELSHISSTLVRENIRSGRPVSDLIFENVEQYIRENKLYMKN